jgi:hypothetical protein
MCSARSLVILIVWAAACTHGYTPVPGVHVPLPIDPTVEVPDNAWLVYAYRILFARDADPGGYTANFNALQAGQSRQQIYDAFVGSPEFHNNPQLADRRGFVTRCFQTLQYRTPTDSEIAAALNSLRNWDGSGRGLTWLQFMESNFNTAAFKGGCPNSYYTLGGRVQPDAVLLNNLFNGTARMQLSSESQLITINMPSAIRMWDQKLSMVADPRGSGFLAFTRAYIGDPNKFTIVLLSSADGVVFNEIKPLFTLGPSQTFYDAHVSVDYSVCPTRYVMAMECIGNEGAASLCISQSTTPYFPESWSHPFVLVDGCTGHGSVCHTNAAESASTGVTLVDGYTRFVAWTQVYDGVQPNDPLAHTYSQSAGPLKSFTQYFGTVMAGVTPIRTMMSSEPHPFCTDAWDCNNRDKQDWKREGQYYYALYNGANYYRCNGRWGISVARSLTPLGEYTDRMPLTRGIPAVRSDTCGISYPMANVIGGEIYVYYAFVDTNNVNHPMRARLVPL